MADEPKVVHAAAEAVVKPSKGAESAVTLTQVDVDHATVVGWNCALDAVLIQLHQRDERGPAGERAGLQDIMGTVRGLKK